MTAVVMMYVYFDIYNEIKIITPVRDDTNEAQGFKCATFRLSEVEDFITAKKNPNNYRIEHRRNDGLESYKIVAKTVSISYLRSIDNYLTQVVNIAKKTSAIRIENNIEEKKVHFYMNEGLKNQINGDIDDDDEYERLSAFKVLNYINFYFTTKDDPSFLIKTFRIVPIDLIKEDCITISYEEDLSNCSLYTKKLFKNYSYKEKGLQDGIY